MQRPFAVHGYTGAGPFQPVRPGEGGALRSVIRVHDVRRPEAVDGLVQRLDAEVSLLGVRDAPGRHFAGRPVDDGDQIETARFHRNAGDISTPDLTRPFDPQAAQQRAACFVALRGLARIGCLIDRHKSAAAHQPPDAFLRHAIAFVAPVPGDLAHAVKGRVEELLVDQTQPPLVSGELSAALFFLYFSGGRDRTMTWDIHRNAGLRC